MGSYRRGRGDKRQSSQIKRLQALILLLGISALLRRLLATHAPLFVGCRI